MRKLHRTPTGKPRRRNWWWVVGGVAALVVVGAAVVGTGSTDILGRQRGIPMLAVKPDLRDFGEIRRGAGKLETTFTLRNEGKAPLQILRITPT